MFSLRIEWPETKIKGIVAVRHKKRRLSLCYKYRDDLSVLMSRGSCTPLALQENVPVATKIRLLGQEITTFEGCVDPFFKGMLSARGKE